MDKERDVGKRERTKRKARPWVVAERDVRRGGNRTGAWMLDDCTTAKEENWLERESVKQREQRTSPYIRLGDNLLTCRYVWRIRYVPVEWSYTVGVLSTPTRVLTHPRVTPCIPQRARASFTAAKTRQLFNDRSINPSRIFRYVFSDQQFHYFSDYNMSKRVLKRFLSRVSIFESQASLKNYRNTASLLGRSHFSQAGAPLYSQFFSVIRNVSIKLSVSFFPVRLLLEFEATWKGQRRMTVTLWHWLFHPRDRILTLSEERGAWTWTKVMHSWRRDASE